MGASADRLILQGITALLVGVALTGHGCARFVGGSVHGKGSVVRVYYDPAAPQQALIGGTEPFSGIQYLVEWLAGVATIVAAAALMVRAHKAQRRANAKEGR